MGAVQLHGRARASPSLEDSGQSGLPAGPLAQSQWLANERAWGAIREATKEHQLNGAIAGDTAAIDYDEEFRRSASHSADIWWDAIDQRNWTLQVQAFTKQPGQACGPWAGGAKDGWGQLVCWEYNQEKCTRTKYKYDHACEQCHGLHLWNACQMGK
uniref:Uncharacterized protein n=1 Tax=Sphaerodactylus townsendi TaxID=933632 RepID=A0ACB8G755_9SAUR